MAFCARNFERFQCPDPSLLTLGGLPPKLLIVHRFTEPMLMRRERIRLDPRVQIAVVMDGFGTPALKRKVYRVTVTNGDGTITLSGPQDLASASTPTLLTP